MEIIKKQYHWGYLTIGVTVLITLALWLGSMWYYDDWYDDPFKYVAKVGSMPATLLMCWAFLLSARFRPVNALFGGLDKVYKAHRHVGEVASVLIFLHPIFLAMHLLPDWGTFGRFFWFSEDWVRNTGLMAIILLVGLVALSIWTPLKYHHWKQTHHFFGLVLVIVVVHGIMGQGEIMRFPLLRTWFIAWITVGLGCYVYIRVLYHSLGPRFTYEVAEVREVDDMAEVYLRPVDPQQRVAQRPGQFVYIYFDTPALRPEPHPFSVSSSPEEEHLRLSVKALGDWTSRLNELQPGVRAQLWGPYGEFGNHLWKRPQPDAVLIAGGIGITPFLSMIRDEAFMQRRQGKTFLIYSVEKPGEASYEDEIRSLDLKAKDIVYLPHCSDKDGFLDAEVLAEKVGELPSKCFYICGPGPMMDSLQKELLEADVPLQHIFKEDFNII
ncbi:ferredoxin reductase family protein [Rhabdobacter roseus]|uniref:Putative ferric reductase n=1 Tax=Rhabdobacter roseus TaxID=1655419 RepID=A0A840TM09_9BACT|nr:ferric reductase-like transmembrane domain-containing protein [Rhabdobacter roseus]MBB5284631.1 putative ferric reductase [Rhabdobacter roseus]